MPVLPFGDWPLTAKKCTYRNGVLRCKLEDFNGEMRATHVQARPDECVYNVNGYLVKSSLTFWQLHQIHSRVQFPGGNWFRKAANFSISNDGLLTADLEDDSGKI